MNFKEIQSAVKHLQKTCKCSECSAKFKQTDINVLASTKNEALFELRCKICSLSTIITVLSASEEKIKDTNVAVRQHGKVSENDILDIKNFLSSFDGNFKKIFKTKK